MNQEYLILRDTFGREGTRLAGSVAATIAATAAGFAVPLIVQAVLDTVFLRGPLPPFEWIRWLLNAAGGVDAVRSRIWLPAAAVITMSGVNGAFSYLGGRWSAVGAERAARTLRDRLYRHIHATSMAWHAHTPSGDLLQRCTSDVDTVRKFFAIQLMEVGRAFAMVLLAVPVMVRLHPGLSLVAFALLPVAFLYTLRFFLNVQDAFTASDEAEGDLSAMLQEHLNGLSVVRAFAREPAEVATFTGKNATHRDLTLHLIMVLARYWGVSSLTVMVQLGAVLVAGSLLAVRGEITVGTLLVFLMLEQMLLWPVRQMGMVLADLGKAKVALRRIAEVLTAPEEDTDPRLRGSGTERPEIRGALVVRDLRFRYTSDSPPVLDGVTFSIAEGETVGILGATGAGKSSFMGILARLWDPDDGSILVDGHEITSIDRRWMRSHVAYVMQEPFLYARTIRDNISFARSSADDVEVFAAARAAAIHDSIEAFRSGYDTAVGERGVTLSGGQKQRVAIARALISEAPILVFDDSLSAVDARTDAEIRSALLDRTATTIIVSHRATTLMRTDRIIVLHDGRVVENGSPDELLGTDGHFARIKRLQEGSFDARL